MFEQVPFDPSLSQALHTPLQASLQQTPSAQKPDTHAAADSHGAPGPKAHAPAPSQTPPVQGVPAAFGLEPFAPLVQVGTTHSAASGTSESSGIDRVVPSAAQTMAAQSPAT